MSDEPARRLFFALWPDEAQRTALVQATERLMEHPGGRPVPAASLHVTLAFLGAVPGGRIALLGALARHVAGGFATRELPLTITFARLAHWAKPQVLVALEGAEGAEGASARAAPVATLASVLARESTAAGFSPDLKPFRAHVTVARKVARAPRTRAMHAVPWSFTAFALIESRTLASGSVYSVLESYVLGSAEKVRA